MRGAAGPTALEAFGPQGLVGALGLLGEPRYRAEQVIRWRYGHGVVTYDEMTDLPATLRSRMAQAHPIRAGRIVAVQKSAIDDTRKYLVEFADGVSVEAVGLPGPGDRLTVCFSTQAGCAMGCAFCATGMQGLERSLLPGEMADQVRLVGEDFGHRVSNAVAMGQGEPFADYDATLAALRLLNHPAALGIGARHLTISTCGLLGGISRLADEPEQFTLAVSLHSAVQGTRDRLMPGVRGIRLADLRAALIAYAQRTGRRPSLEYALIQGVNDTPEELDALVAFCHSMLVHVNLIPANAVPGTNLEQASSARVRAFADRLAEVRIEHSVRAERGADIDAACGQLRQRALSSSSQQGASRGQTGPAAGQKGQ